MAEKRKAVATYLLRIAGKKSGSTNAQKVELFDSREWPRHFFKSFATRTGRHASRTFRIRVNGKWFNDAQGQPIAYCIWKVRDLYFRTSVKSINRAVDQKRQKE